MWSITGSNQIIKSQDNFDFLTEENKATEVVDESDKELIRVAREDVEDEEPKEKPHKEKKRSTEGRKLMTRAKAS